MYQSYGQTCCHMEVFTLPNIQFVGGSTQELLYRVYAHKVLYPFDLEGCTAEFAIVNYINRYSDPLVKKSMTIVKGDKDDFGDVINNTLSVTLAPGDTKDLHGKFIYQITIKDSHGTVEIPNQGLAIITNNIDKAFI